jgi:hypothetical protein
LAAYAPDSVYPWSPALRGHLYALEGYAEVLLADLYCSGIPLSTVDFGADYTLAPGSSTREVYTHAVTLFDSALALFARARALNVDSVRLQQLAAVGRGRALLAVDSFAAAQAAVAGVPDAYRYPLVYDGAGNRLLSRFVQNYARGGETSVGIPSVADQEGGNGLDYRSRGDPRVPVLVLEQPDQDGILHTLYFPAKYPVEGPDTIPLADGLEARLIEAEAALQAGSAEWLTQLNALRTDGTFDETQPNPDEPQLDTLWHAGRGGVPGLAPLADPGSPAAQVDLVFRERAFWLYLTGRRQGDLRRLIRQYHRSPETVYPSGFYPGGSGGYGSGLVLPVPDSERQRNPQYTGCFHRDA